jgi:hypothetical protein
MGSISTQDLTPTASPTFVGVTLSTGNAVITAGDLIITVPTTPASAAASGTIGTIAWDTGYLYVCTATNTWERVAIASW